MSAANSFLIINLGELFAILLIESIMKYFHSTEKLGCEMLYVIEQRLKAQNIALEKSAQGKYLIVSSISDVSLFA